MIEHDAGRFLGWSAGRTDTLAVRTYTNGHKKTLQIMNVNRWPIETALGADLIYYHVQRRSFVTVQYKRMITEGGSWLYRSDSHLEKQIHDMRKLDDACVAAGTDRYRFTAAPSFLKICRLESLHVDDLSLIPGMYLTREHAEKHLADTRSDGERGGKYFSFENVDPYLTNTMFTDLVAYGLVGTSGASTTAVQQAIDASLNRRGAAVLGILDDQSGRRPGWMEEATIRS
jgi:hypothetical protein